MLYVLLAMMLTVSSADPEPLPRPVDDLLREVDDGWRELREACEVADEVPDDPRLPNPPLSRELRAELIGEWESLSRERRACANDFVDSYRERVRRYCAATCGGPSRDAVCETMLRHSIHDGVVQAAIAACPEPRAV